MRNSKIIAELSEQIPQWWATHQYDVCGDWNLFDDEPPFVEMVAQNVAKVPLAVAVIKWWKEHRYDTCGPRGDYNVFNGTPDFVETALAVLGIDEASLDSHQAY